MSKAELYPSKHPIWAIMLSASISLTGFGISKSGAADSLNSHKLDPGYCYPNAESASNGTHVGPSVNTLANIITVIRRGQPVEVISKPVPINGIGIPGATAIPIVFEVKGQECFAFTVNNPETEPPQLSSYKEAQEFYTIMPEPSVDKNIPLVEATQVSGELGVIETQNGLIAGWAETKFTNPGCTFESCPDPSQQEIY